MLSQHNVACVLCLTAVSIQQNDIVFAFYRAINESDKLLEKNLFCAKMVLKLLTQEQKAHIVNACQDILQQLEANDKLLEKVITGDKLCIFQYNPETMQQSCQWKSTYLPRPKKAHMQRSQMKVM